MPATMNARQIAIRARQHNRLPGVPSRLRWTPRHVVRVARVEDIPAAIRAARQRTVLVLGFTETVIPDDPPFAGIREGQRLFVMGAPTLWIDERNENVNMFTGGVEIYQRAVRG